jgi:hypothetical protein
MILVTEPDFRLVTRQNGFGEVRKHTSLIFGSTLELLKLCDMAEGKEETFLRMVELGKVSPET